MDTMNTKFITPPAGPSQFDNERQNPNPTRQHRKVSLSRNAKLELRRRSGALQDAGLCSPSALHNLRKRKSFNFAETSTAIKRSHGIPGGSDGETAHSSESSDGDETAAVLPVGMLVPDEEQRREFEETRKRNILERQQILKMHGFKPIAAPQSSGMPSPAKHENKRESDYTIKVPNFRMSLRSRNSEGLAEVAGGSRQVEEDDESEDSDSDAEDGPVPMTPINDINQENYFASLLPDTDTSHDSSTVPLHKYRKVLMSLRLENDSVRKVGERTFSMAIHPSDQKLLVVVGDKLGNLGFWDAKSPSVPLLYRPHKHPIFCTTFCPQNISRLYTTSINGITKRCDLETLTFEKVYMSMVGPKGHTPWHHLRNQNELLIAHGDGSVGLIDLRSGIDPIHLFQCHPRSVRTVQTHPIKDFYFMTASGIGGMAIWDIRKTKSKKCVPVCSSDKAKGLKSAFFSPDGKIALSTGNDDHLRLHNCEDAVTLTETVGIYHNNQTGRWLTPFKAMWHPSRSDLFVVGSMDRVRSVDIMASFGEMVCKITDPLLTTILSVVQFHPTLDIIIGCNSSGRVHVFKPANDT